MGSDKLPSDKPTPSLLRRWLREPLLHVLLIGAALFALYYALNPDAGQHQDSNRIVITADDLAQIRLAWMAQWQRPPTPEEMRNLLDGKIREEVLSREAMALGLDKADTIVKRRLAQKMEFVMEDASALREPVDDELRRWFAQNAQRFATSSLVTFRHLYFSPDLRGARARDDADGGVAKACRQAGGSPGTGRIVRSLHVPGFLCRAVARSGRQYLWGRLRAGAARLEQRKWQGHRGFGWAGTWFGLNRQCLAAFLPSKKSRQGQIRMER